MRFPIHDLDAICLGIGFIEKHNISEIIMMISAALTHHPGAKS